MLVHRLKEFIAALELKKEKIKEKDLIFLQAFQEKFSNISEMINISNDDIQWIESIFTQRWNVIANTVDDYTLNPIEPNNEWILLAKSIESETNKPYWEVLIPVIQNEALVDSVNMAHFRMLINELFIGCSVLIGKKLEAFWITILDIKRIDTSIVETIVDIYSHRWQEVIDSENDYMRVMSKLNSPWISLAKYLATKNLINPNYYKLLIPTLSHNNDLLTEEPLIDKPLTHYILSDNGRELVFLPNCINYHKNNDKDTLYNCNHKQVIPLTKKEKERLLYSSQTFVRYFKDLEEKKEDLTISKKTVDKVRKLVEGSLYPVGLALGGYYNKMQMESADLAYEKFLEFFVTLPNDEQTDLLNQHISFRDKLLTFEQIMENVQRKGDCIAVWGQFFLKLVVDYNPFIHFSDELEVKVDIASMRRLCAKKVYQDYDKITEHEAMQRILIIFVSLMTHSFKYMTFTGSPVSVWDCYNTVTLTGKKLYEILAHVIIDGKIDAARFVYASLIESIVKPALAHKGFLTTVSRYTDTELWLKTIEDNSMFHQKNVTFFDPEVLLSVLWRHTCDQKNFKTRQIIDAFIEEIIRTLAQSENDYLKWVRINIKFVDCLNKLNEKERLDILDKLRNPELPIGQLKISQYVKNFVIHRLACYLVQASNTKTFKFFKNDNEINVTSYDDFSNSFLTKLIHHGLIDSNKASNGSMKELLNALQSIAQKAIAKFVGSNAVITSYLDKLTDKISSDTNNHWQMTWKV